MEDINWFIPAILIIILIVGNKYKWFLRDDEIKYTSLNPVFWLILNMKRR